MTATPAEIPSRLVDQLITLYCNWRAECALVKVAYERFSRAAPRERAIAFAAYGAALDREASAADSYASQVDLVTSMCV